MKRQPRIVLFVTVTILYLLISACGGQQQAGGSSGTQTEQSTKEEQSNDSTPSVQPVDKSLKKVKIVRTINNLIFMPLFVASERGYFEEEGIDAEIIAMG